MLFAIYLTWKYIRLLFKRKMYTYIIYNVCNLYVINVIILQCKLSSYEE